MLEEFVVEGWGEEAYDQILSHCPLHTKEPFVGPGTYADADLFAIIKATCARLGIGVPDAVRAFGTFAFPRLAARYPMFMEGHSDAKSFLLTVHGVIHVEVKKLMPKAAPPSFEYEELGPGKLAVRYYSRRKLCAMFEGLVQGAAHHFDEKIECVHDKCMHDGHDFCRLEMRFYGASERAA